MFSTKEWEDFRQFMRTCSEERMDELAVLLTADEKYQAAVKEKIGLYKAIYAGLAEELKKTLDQYNHSEGVISDMEKSFFYAHGFQDACLLLRFFFCKFFSFTP